MISILTVNFRSAADLVGLADSIERHAGGEQVELVITNNSPEEPVALAARPGLPVSVQDSPNHGFAAGINLAFRRCVGDVVMIANPDVRLTAGALPDAAAYLRQHPRVGVLLPRLRYPDGRLQLSVRQFYTWPVALYARSPLRWLGYTPAFFRRYMHEGVDFSEPTPVDWGLGAAMFLRRSDCDPDGVFDEGFFMYFEDVDLCYRMWQRGRPVMHCPHIVCVHAHKRFSRNPISVSGWRHLHSLLRFIRKHGGLPPRPVVQHDSQA